jgi:hypothetical protein
MKTLKTMLVLSAAGAALLATPAFAQHSYQPSQPSQFERQFSVGSQETGSEANTVERDTGTYANGTN